MRVNFNRDISMRKNNNYSFKGQEIGSKSPFINNERMVDTFITLAQIDSASNPKVEKSPSSEGQKLVAQTIKSMLEKTSATEIEMNDFSVLTATLESNVGDNQPVIGLITHMDTSPDAPSNNIKPQLHKNYQGGDIVLNEGTVIPAKVLEKHIGKTIITSDGTTLLGADDKAGATELIELARIFSEHPELKHPKIRLAFTPDEEIGRGINHFDTEKFGADIAYTIDGESPAVIEKESFNAYNPKVTVLGKSTHLGNAKEGEMKNSIKPALWIISQLPENQSPERTEKRQGYYHADEIHGTVGKTEIDLVLRDHSRKQIQRRLEYIKQVVEKAKEKFKVEITFDPNEAYKNMKTKIDEIPQIMEITKEGLKRTGYTPIIKPIRGGTDGSGLTTERNLRTPNLGTGGYNYHSKSEFSVVEEMGKSLENLINIISVWVEEGMKKDLKSLFKK